MTGAGAPVSGIRADVYCDLRLKCTSIRALDGDRKGRVVSKPAYSVVHGVTFRVQAAGVLRIRNRGQREVVAYARGIASDSTPAEVSTIAADPGAQRVHFNPFRSDSFHLDDGTPVHSADVLAIDHKTAYVVNPR